ncbi:LysM peptidoglycan-binding domain-containing protein [Phaeobacter inhibens]|uniref:LysM peptidoglycan-binding domain-containing protein n=1 Tax=Phaeobacter inhibens TaxID=221822 RepID=UPI000C9CDC38|nr:LysM peptidoglycan-binding domain-containing protein [Phaeobacter inhibens]AUQ54582.1 LysM domain protein [Phaeobacter inhibens]AUQ78598.1 LysM domain protein [Phaeobacter inhibens]AUR15757.1 LysM domain protein [Phaeobacter inhibens]
MTDVTGKGGLSATAIGGIAAVVVVLGGVIFLQWGGPSAQKEELRSAAGKGDGAVISPSAGPDGALGVPVPANEPPVAQSPAVDAETDSAEAAVPAGDVDAAELPGGDTSAQAAADEAAGEDAAPTLGAPQMDLARFETDGSGMVAGRATPGAVVSLLLDGVVVEQLTVPSNGSFVLFTTVAPSARPQVISLEAALGETVLPSDAQFILAPVAPVVVAETQLAEEAATDEQASGEQTTGEPVTGQPAADVASAAAPEGDRPAVDTADADTKLSGAQAASDSDTAVAVAPLAEAAQEAADAPDLPTAQASEAGSASEEPAVAATAGDGSDVTQGETVTASNDTQVLETQVAAATDESGDEAQDAAPAQVSEAGAAQSDETPAAATAPETAPEQRAVLRSDASGVTLVQPPTPTLADAPETVALDTISYDAEGAVVLSGRVRSDAVVRAYLDNAAVADLPVDEEGRWSGVLPDVAPGIYALRLDALDTEGKVLSRLETPFKREAPEVLQPSLETTATDATSPDAAPTGAKPLVRLVTVQEGDTLWAISRERYGDGLLYVRVFDANREAIRDPDLIYPGQVFSVPVQ